MRILATGGAGYVGSATVRALLAKGHEVTVYDNLSKGHSNSVPAETFVRGDIADHQRLAAVLQEHHIDAVMHFAGYIAVGESAEKPREYYRNNICNSLTVLEAMLEARVDRILFSSTAAIYRPQPAGTLSEHSPQQPESPYAFSKYVIERLIEDFCAAYGLGYVHLRYFNACGASPDGQFGEDHQPETHLIPLVLQVPWGQREKIGVFGNDYETPDGTCIRDYIHVDDLAGAHILAVENIEPGSGTAYNVGTGTGCSVLEVISTAERVVGRQIPIEFLPRRAGDTARLVAAPDQLKNDLSWRPQYTDLADTIATAWQWHKTHPNGYQ